MSRLSSGLGQIPNSSPLPFSLFFTRSMVHAKTNHTILTLIVMILDLGSCAPKMSLSKSPSISQRFLYLFGAKGVRPHGPVRVVCNSESLTNTFSALIAKGPLHSSNGRSLPSYTFSA